MQYIYERLQVLLIIVFHCCDIDKLRRGVAEGPRIYLLNWSVVSCVVDFILIYSAVVTPGGNKA